MMCLGLFESRLGRARGEAEHGGISSGLAVEALDYMPHELRLIAPIARVIAPDAHTVQDLSAVDPFQTQTLAERAVRDGIVARVPVDPLVRQRSLRILLGALPFPQLLQREIGAHTSEDQANEGHHAQHQRHEEA